MSVLSDLLFEYYMAWQKEVGGRRTLKQYSEHIGIGEVFLNQIMNDKRNAGEKTVDHLVQFFKDPRFYDAAGIPRPDINLKYTMRNWGSLPEEEVQKIKQIVAKYTTETPPEEP